MKKKIFLHGHLAEAHPHPIEVEAETVAEAVMSLKQIPALHPKNEQPHPVRISGVDTEIALFSKTNMKEIHIYPRTGGEGGGKGGLGQILLGIALVAVGFFNPGAFLAAEGLFSASSLIMSGALMALGGLLQMMVPVPEEDDTSNPSSNILGANQNTVQIGTHVPIGYGHAKAAGHYISFDVDAVDQANGARAGGGQYSTEYLEYIQDGGTVSNPLNDALAGDDNSETEEEEEEEEDALAGVVDENIYVLYDKPDIPICQVNPVYNEPTASPTNIPTSNWVS